MGYESFYEALRYHLEKKGYGGQALLCRHTDIPRSYLSRIMGRGRRAGSKTQRKIARFFGYGLEEFSEIGRRITLGEDPEQATDLLRTMPEEHLVQRLTAAVRKEMHTARLLNQTQVLYENIVENSRQMIVRFDHRMRITFVNRATEQLTGSDRAALLGRSWLDLVSAHCRAELSARVTTLAESGGSFSLELPGTSSPRWLYLTITVFSAGVGGQDRGQLVGFDMTKEKEIRRRLEENERDLHAIYDGSPDMMASVDAATGLILKCNRTMGEKLGYAQDRIIRASLFSFCHAPGRKDARRVFREFLHTHEVRDQELVLQRKNGALLPVLLNMTPIRDGEGRVIASNCVLRDQSERRKLVDRLRFIQHGVEMSYVPTLWVGHQGNIVYVNRAVSNLLGYSKEELEGMHVWDINPLIPRNAWSSKWAWFQEKENVAFAGQYRSRDGAIIPVEFQVSNLAYPDGRRYNVVFVKPMTAAEKEHP